MRWLRPALLSFLLLFSGCREPAADEPQSSPGTTPTVQGNEQDFFQPRNEVFKRRKAAEKDDDPVKVKVKRDAKDGYTWELTGNNAKEILKVDRELRRGLLTTQDTRAKP